MAIPIIAFLEAVAPLIPMVVKLIEQTVPGPKKGRTKRRRAVKAIEQLAGAVPGVARQVGDMIDEAVARMNAAAAPPP
jgi:hypothetical protein